jgi:hypothetical protein
MFQRCFFSKEVFSGGEGDCGRRSLPVSAFCLESQFPAKYSNWGFKKLMKMKTPRRANQNFLSPSLCSTAFFLCH